MQSCNGNRIVKTIHVLNRNEKKYIFVFIIKLKFKSEKTQREIKKKTGDQCKHERRTAVVICNICPFFFCLLNINLQRMVLLLCLNIRHHYECRMSMGQIMGYTQTHRHLHNEFTIRSRARVAAALCQPL